MMAERTFDFPANAKAVARRLGISRGTLDAWIAKDRELAPAERKFHFHAYRGRKRVWTEAAFQALQSAVERESADGGCLSRWRNPAGARSKRALEASHLGQAALKQVLNFRPGPATVGACHNRAAQAGTGAASEPAA